MTGNEGVRRELVRAHGRTYVEEAGIRLKDTPQPLYRLLVPAVLLGARIRASVAVAAARALHEAGLRDPRRTAEADWQQRVDALGRGGYRRYDERNATLPRSPSGTGGTPIRSGFAPLGDGAQLLTERRAVIYGGCGRRRTATSPRCAGCCGRFRAWARPAPASSCARPSGCGRKWRPTSTTRPSRARSDTVCRRIRTAC